MLALFGRKLPSKDANRRENDLGLRLEEEDIVRAGSPSMRRAGGSARAAGEILDQKRERDDDLPKSSATVSGACCLRAQSVSRWLMSG